MALKICKDCGKELSSDLKKCPSCGKDQRNWFMKHKIITFIGAFILLVIIIPTNKDTDKKNELTIKQSAVNITSGSSITNNNLKTVSPTPTILPSSGISSDVEIKVLESYNKKAIGDNEFYRKEALGIYKIIKLSLKNNQDDAITVNANSFKLFDSKEREFSYSSEAQTALMISLNNKESFFLKKINPGLTIEGYIVFEIPKEENTYKLSARGGMLGDEIFLKVD
jgi:hypothetical protein